MGPKTQAGYINELWNDAENTYLKDFFCYKTVFITSLDIEVKKLSNPEMYGGKNARRQEKIDYEDMTMAQLKVANPQYYSELKEKVRAKYRDKENSSLYRCAICGNLFSANNVQIDHIKPISKGGKTKEDNLQILCRTCNQRKSDR